MICKFKHLVRWTHFHDPSWGERCIVMEIRGGLRGFLFGTHKILLEDGYVGWCYKNDVGKINPDIPVPPADERTIT